MPPKKKEPTLTGITIAFSGSFERTRNEMTQLVTDNGGKVSSSITKATDYLVATEEDAKARTTKVMDAVATEVPVVSEDWLDDAAAKGTAGLDLEDYKIEVPTLGKRTRSAPLTTKTAPKPPSKKKTKAEEVESEEEEEEEEEVKAAPKGRKKTPPPAPAKVKAPAPKKKAKLEVEEEVEEEEEEEEEVEEAPKKKATKKTKKEDDGGDKEIPSGPFPGVKIKAPKVSTYKYKSGSEPPFPESSIEVVRNAVLLITDIKNNHNKYYAVELHKTKSGKQVLYRVFTHYGRTDDLDKNPNSGQKETRYVDDFEEAKALYNHIYKEKTSPSKGYQPVNLASSSIGSHFSRGSRVGKIDKKTKAKLDEAASSSSSSSAEPEPKKKKTPSKLPAEIQELVTNLYNDATKSLTNQVKVSITKRGLETPLGVLTIRQIEDGEAVLDEIGVELKRAKPRRDVLERLTSSFYTKIPHNIGRSAAAVAASVIKTTEVYKEKLELINLMKDVVAVNSKGKNVLFDDDVDEKYEALGTNITLLKETSAEYKRIYKFLATSQTPEDGYGALLSEPKEDDEEQEEIDNYSLYRIYKITRPGEEERFASHIGNEHLLYHGSRACNFVGLLSRGILMPQAVTKLGVPRTDFGWLGAGIYFGDCFETSGQYCIPSDNTGHSYFFLCNVALGKFYEQGPTDGTITAPPKGFNSIHGNPDLPDTGFSDHEWCIYNENQQVTQYLIEYEEQ